MMFELFRLEPEMMDTFIELLDLEVVMVETLGHVILMLANLF